MKDSKYFGLASGENGLYKTLDNGLHWESISLENSQASGMLFGRIIFGSNENKGLTYSDDGGVTRNPSNITDGNWGLIRYSKDKKLVYAASFDNRGIVVSSDFGEFWKSTNIAEGNFNSAWEGDGSTYNENDIIYGSNDGGVSFGDGKGRGSGDGLTTRGSVFGLGTSVTSNGNINSVLVEKSVIPVINKIVAPQIYLEITGKRYYDEVGDLNLLRPEVRDLYINAKNYYENSIDWEEDLGMRPFELKLEDLIENNENITLKEVIEDNDTEIMKKNIEKVRKFIAARKSAAMSAMANRITSTTVDNSNLFDIIEDKEKIATAVTTEKSFEDVLKAAAIAVMTEVYNRIFAFDNAMIRKLIYSGIYETIIILAGNLKRQLDLINSEFVSNNDIKISYDFAQGLNVAFDKYLHSVTNAIKIVNETADKDLIAFAADYYHTQKKYYLEQANNVFSEIDFSIEDCKKAYEDVEDYTIEKYINDLYKKTLQEFQRNLKVNFKYPIGLENKTYKEREVICNYADAIHRKFISRCYEYTKYVYGNLLSFEYSGTYDLDNLENIKIEFLKEFKLSWNDTKELI